MSEREPFHGLADAVLGKYWGRPVIGPSSPQQHAQTRNLTNREGAMLRKIDWESVAWFALAFITAFTFGACLLCMVGAVVLRMYVGW